MHVSYAFAEAELVKDNSLQF